MDYFIFGEFMSCFIDFIDINLLEKYTLTNLVSEADSSRICNAEAHSLTPVRHFTDDGISRYTI